MTVRPTAPASTPALSGLEGELLRLSIAVEPKLLEDLLDALSHVDFPVNPQLYHRPAQVTVEFPAYSTRVEEVRHALREHGFPEQALEASRILAATGR